MPKQQLLRAKTAARPRGTLDFLQKFTGNNKCTVSAKETDAKMRQPHAHAHPTLAEDLRTLQSRRHRRRAILQWVAGASALGLVGCQASSSDCDAIPEETAGPYPGDGSNGANALTLSGIVRSDIRSSLGGASGVAAGVPLTLKLTVLGSDDSCGPLAGYAVYLWHCDRDGAYSMYSSEIADESYLRGVQETDSDGTVTFTTVFPGCYSGRWPHIHFEVYPSIDAATNADNKIATSQLALPEDACAEAYAAEGYDKSVQNLSNASLEDDNVFGDDGAVSQLAEVTGSVSEGFTATLVFGVSS